MDASAPCLVVVTPELAVFLGASTTLLNSEAVKGLFRIGVIKGWPESISPEFFAIFYDFLANQKQFRSSVPERQPCPD
jgi:hypothetical protein